MIKSKNGLGLVAAISIFSLFSILMMSAGCGKSKPADKSVELSFYSWGSSTESALWKEMLKEFEQEYPQIRVKFELPPNYLDKLLTVMAAGTPPDVFWSGYDRFSAYTDKGQLLDLSGFINNDKELSLNDYFPIAVESAKYKGKVYILPMELNLTVLFYNKKLFKEAGLDYPDKSWTWETFLQAAKKLTKDKNGDGRTDQYGAYLYEVLFDMIYQNGGRIFNETETECFLNQPGVVEAVQFYRDLLIRHKVALTLMRGGVQTLDTSPEQIFTNGRAAMLLGPRPFVARFRQAKNLQWDVAPLPRGKINAVRVWGTGACISKLTKHPKEAYLLAKFLTGPKMQTYFAQGGISIPALKKIAYSNDFYDKPTLSPQNNRVFVDELKYGIPDPQTPKFAEILGRIIWPNLELVWMGKTTTQESCLKIKKMVDETLKQ